MKGWRQWGPAPPPGLKAFFEVIRHGMTRKKAAKKACCDDFIEALPDDDQTAIGEDGASPSGGKQETASWKL